MTARAPSPDFTGLFREPTRGAPITTRNLGRRFGDLQVLRSFELHVPAGQFLAIVGRSGCGKSTLLRILAGLDHPSSGECRFGDDPSNGETRADARIMFQEPRLLPWASVLSNVEVGLSGAASAPDSRRRALETLAAVGLEDRADNWPSVLSGGQKQRVALARALVSRPRFLALDEPLGALDALTRIEMQGLIERVWQEQRFTAVLVTHDVSEALALGDRVVMIEDGRIALDISVTLPRPRRRGSVDLAVLEERILAQILQREKTAPEYVI
ncbi:MAG TPA: ATP-binding cassette domain-containing protein [Rhodoblastus sp.]|nr:ATP-binding cassette domain-containing protein [Rhodoblastus sp.]